MQKTDEIPLYMNMYISIYTHIHKQTHAHTRTHTLKKVFIPATTGNLEEDR